MFIGLGYLGCRFLRKTYDFSTLGVGGLESGKVPRKVPRQSAKKSAEKSAEKRAETQCRESAESQKFIIKTYKKRETIEESVRNPWENESK